MLLIVRNRSCTILTTPVKRILMCCGGGLQVFSDCRLDLLTHEMAAFSTNTGHSLNTFLDPISQVNKIQQGDQL